MKESSSPGFMRAFALVFLSGFTDDNPLILAEDDVKVLRSLRDSDGACLVEWSLREGKPDRLIFEGVKVPFVASQRMPEKP